MTKGLNDKKAEFFKALSNPVRLDIIDELLTGEKCVCEIQSALKKYEQSHISKGLAKLKSVGIIKDRKDGLNVYYNITMGCIRDFIACLNENVCIK